MQDIVSIITPMYNADKYIEETILSVINQSYQNWEMIIVDDNSTDNSCEIVEAYQRKDQRIILTSNKYTKGAAGSRNTAISLSKGRFIAFLDSDDLWTSNKLDKQIHFMQKMNYYFTYSFYDHISEEGKYLKSIDNLPLRVDYISSMKSNKIGCLTAIFDVNYFGKIYMEDLAKRQDYTLWLKLLKKVDFAYCLPEVLCRYRIRHDSISSNKLKLVRYHWHIYRKIEKQGFFRSVYYLGYYIFVRIFEK